jgi:hypothetical protein
MQLVANQHAFFATENDSILILSVFWIVFLKLDLESLNKHFLFRKKVEKIKKINAIYEELIKSKDYKDDMEKLAESRKNYNLNLNRFGNTDFVSFNNIRNKFEPFANAIDYIKINKSSKNSEVQGFISKKIPYISGYSGIANMTCQTITIMGLYTKTDVIIMLIESMSAFIVGTGMHSYEEVYTSFNLFLEL